MPKNRKRVTRKGAKSLSVQTKHKIGGRKSNKGAKRLSTKEIEELMNKVAKRDRNKLKRELEARRLIHA